MPETPVNLKWECDGIPCAFAEVGYVPRDEVITVNAGLAEARKNDFEIIICDIGLPGIDGFRVVPVTREWCEGSAWREWCGWRIDANRGPFYGDTPAEAVVAVRRGTLRIVRAA